MLYIALFVILLCFALAGMVGAPYVPMRSRDFDTIFALADLKPGETLLELGCGDGKVLVEAAKRGYRAVGIEVNPVMYVNASLRCLRYRTRVEVHLGDMWRSKWPPSDAIFIFLIPRLMQRLDATIPTKITAPTRLVSYTFEIEDRAATKTAKNCWRYDYAPLAKNPVHTTR